MTIPDNQTIKKISQVASLSSEIKDSLNFYDKKILTGKDVCLLIPLMSLRSAYRLLERIRVKYHISKVSYHHFKRFTGKD